MGENIGAAARGMANFGLTDLRLVNPRDGWPNERAADTASGALEHMPPARVFQTLPEALADCQHIYGTTARERNMRKPVLNIQDAMKQAQAQYNQGLKIGFVFGPERTGLENEDLSVCHTAVMIPTNPEFSSINLGQSVFLTVYEWFRCTQNSREHPNTNLPHMPAPHENLYELLNRLESELDQAGFFRSDALRPTMMRNIRNMIIRGTPTDQEVRTFHGIISALIGKKSKKP